MLPPSSTLFVYDHRMWALLERVCTYAKHTVFGGKLMRIVTGTISHETNVFSNIATDLEEFKKRCLVYGADVFDRFSGTKTPAGGII